MKQILASAFMILLLTAAAGNQTPGPVTYHVSSAGNDGNPGTQEAPFATIAHAASKAKAGDTVKIGPGLYREQITFTRPGSLPGTDHVYPVRYRKCADHLSRQPG